MSHSLLPVLLHNLPILLATADATRFTKLDHDQEDRGTRHANKGGRDKAVLVPQVFDPGGNPASRISSLLPSLDREEDSPITNSKGHGVSHQDDTGHRHSTELSVAVNHIIDAQSNAAGVGEG